MSSPSDSDGDSAGAIAAAMGFSGFGQQARPSKKRRFNPRADASTSADASSHAPRPSHPSAPRPTAANTTPLGPPRPRPQQTSNLPLHPNPTAPPAEDGPADDLPAQDEGYLTDPDPPPQYVDTSWPVGAPRPADKPPTADELREEQARIDAIVAAGDALYATSALDGQHGSRHGFRPSVVGSTPGSGRGSVSGAAAGFHPGSKPARGRGKGGALGGRVGQGSEGREWYVGYYDPSSNENPWARLEAALGLMSKGTWLARTGGGGRPVATAAEREGSVGSG